MGYCHALRSEQADGQVVYLAQECDARGEAKPSAKVQTVPAVKFEEHYEPVKRQSKKTHESPQHTQNKMQQTGNLNT